MRELKPTLFAEINRVCPQRYNVNWVEDAITEQLTPNSQYRRKAVALQIQKWFQGFKNDWWLSHSVRINEAAVIESIFIHQRSYSSHLLEIMLSSVKLDASLPSLIFLGEETPMTEENCFKRMAEFFSLHNRMFSDVFAKETQKLFRELIQAFGPHFEVTRAESDDLIKKPHLRLKIKSTKPVFDFSIAFILIVPAV